MTTPSHTSTDFLAELSWRGQIAQCTDEAGLRTHLADPSSAQRRAYIGFDPTADSFTVGNLVQMLTLRRFQLAGHAPVVVAGGGTGLIGDPSGKSAEREINTREKVAANVASQMRIFSRVIDFSPTISARATLLNNIDWLGSISYLDALRDIGKHFSVNMMVQKDSVRARLEERDQGISYTEFSYMILQAYDFQVLHKTHGVTLQMGGSDQWGNIVAGSDLIRKAHFASGGSEQSAPRVFGLTTPLVTKSDGGKFGKSESGAIWLTADRTSPYAFYQFWLNSADADLPKFLRTFTHLSRSEIEGLEASHAADPGKRDAHRALARHMTEMLHGVTERENAENAAKALFSGDVASLQEATFREVMASAPTTTHDKARLGAGIPILELLEAAAIVKSRGEGRDLLKAGSISLNGKKLSGTETLTNADLLHGRFFAIRRGKKEWHMLRFED
jgi:tyrosyl-tRNA synthetase